LCISCNRPAPEFDRYAALTQEVLITIVDGVTLLRLSQLGTTDQKKHLHYEASDWQTVARHVIDLGNDYREMKEITTTHADCDAWKLTFRRMNSLLRELDFMRSLTRPLAS
jgi:hypothetical protein